MLRALAIALAIAAWGCEQGASAEWSCGSQAAALYNGSSEPAPLELSVGERNAIVGLESSAGSHLCTGTLISSGWVLSAGHCANNDELLVRIDRRAFGAGKRVAHPELDALLIELVPGETPELDVTPVPPWQGTVDEGWIGGLVTLAGRGMTETGALGELFFAEERVVDIRPSEIWVDGEGRTGACGGDSGGPLLVTDATGSARVAGVLDRGSANCLGVDVYTRIDRLSAWIRGIIGQRTGADDAEPCRQRGL
ncbi:MAG TPA: trypsin-like serine protease [Polyangiaceae bacterium]|nr:trypsin-like serine protease [Polyangiaceae bacterium]